MAPAKKNEKSAVGEDFAKIRGDIAHIRGSIAGIHEKMELLDLIAQKLLGEDSGKQVEDVKKLEEPSLMDLCDCWIVGTEEDKVKRQPEEEILASEDSNQIVSNIGGSLRKFDQIVDQIQLFSEEKKTEEDEIGIVSDVGGLLEKVDQIVKQEELISAPEATPASEEEQTDELNRNTKKKKKRWKKRFKTQPRHNKKMGDLNKSISAHQVFDGKSKARERSKLHCQVMKGMAEKANKKTGVRIRIHSHHIIDIKLLKVINKKKKRTRLKEQLAVKHFSVEGQLKSEAILLVPKGAPSDPFDKGKKCSKLFLETAKNMKDYNGLYETFSKNLMVGIHEDSQNRTKISELPCYYSTRSSDELTSIKDYLTRRREDYHWLVTNHELDRGWLLMFKKERNKTKMGCAEKGLKHDKKVYQRRYGKLSWKYRSEMKQLVKWKGCRFKLKHYMSKKNIKERLSGNQIDCIGNSKLDYVLFRKLVSRWCKRKHGRERIYLGREKLPHVLKRAFKIVEGSTSSVSGNPDELAKFSPGLNGQLSVPVVSYQNTTLSGQKLKVSVVLSGGQAPEKHRVTSGLFKYLQEHVKGSTLACGRRDKIETPEQFKQAKEAAKKLNLDPLVVIGGDNVNANACLLAENFRTCKIYSEMIGNVMMDGRSTGRVVDGSGLWKKEITEQSLNLFDLLPEAIQEQLMIDREAGETLKDIDVDWWKQNTMGSSTTRRIGNLEAVRDLQVENIRTLTLTTVKWISDWSVPASLASDALLQLIPSPINIDCTWQWRGSMKQHFLQHDLGDKVSFNGGGIDTIWPNTKGEEAGP